MVDNCSHSHPKEYVSLHFPLTSSHTNLQKHVEMEYVILILAKHAVRVSWTATSYAPTYLVQEHHHATMGHVRMVCACVQQEGRALHVNLTVS
jgi:hypothetical protein